MTAHHKPRVKSLAIHGVIPGSTYHRILLALRPNGMSNEQISERFGYQSGGLTRLKNSGLINTPSIGKKGDLVTLTDFGRCVTEPSGPLSRKHFITYCQL